MENVVKEMILMAALSLPSTHHHRMILEEERPPVYNQLKDLQRWINEHHPGAEVQIVPDGQTTPMMEKLPFTWGGMDVYIKRKTVYDKRPLYSA
jgi:hypothetical protein